MSGGCWGGVRSYGVPPLLVFGPALGNSDPPVHLAGGSLTGKRKGHDTLTVPSSGDDMDQPVGHGTPMLVPQADGW